MSNIITRLEGFVCQMLMHATEEAQVKANATTENKTKSNAI